MPCDSKDVWPNVSIAATVDVSVFFIRPPKDPILTPKLAMVFSLLQHGRFISYTNTTSENYNMKDSFLKIIERTGEDVTRPGLLDTPDRASKALA
tara:strand:- start:553 stop:837 length:285 start_codon:yes stop_codon:yes gene_type:complete